MRFFYFIISLLSFILLISCNDNKSTTIESTKPVSLNNNLIDPFKYHKLIEVSPGQYYDIFSWSRGSKNAGAYLILHSDSSGKKYTTTYGDLDGTIVDVYNSDLDADGNPELLIQIKISDTVNYTNIYAYEFSNEKSQKLTFPRLSKSQSKGYHGNDNFYLKDGQLFREFPIFNGDAAKAKNNNQKRLLQYGIKNNTFSVKQISKDSVSIAGKTIIDKPIQNHAIKEKKIVIVKKHKKKHKYHNKNDSSN